MPDKEIKRRFLTWAMLASSFMSMLLLSFRMYITGSAAYIFLAWNLFLAWIPFLCALCLEEVKMYSRGKWISLGLAGIWLVFFPNSPYIITDLFHLYSRPSDVIGLPKARPGMPLWFDLFLIISFAWNGLMLGFASLRMVQEWLGHNYRKWISWALLVPLMFLCGYGVYLGRFERWNSWDVLSHGNLLSKNILHHLLDPFSNLRMLGVTLIYGSFLLLGYLTLLAFTNIARDEQ